MIARVLIVLSAAVLLCASAESTDASFRFDYEYLYTDSAAPWRIATAALSIVALAFLFLLVVFLCMVCVCFCWGVIGCFKGCCWGQYQIVQPEETEMDGFSAGEMPRHQSHDEVRSRGRRR